MYDYFDFLSNIVGGLPYNKKTIKSKLYHNLWYQFPIYMQLIYLHNNNTYNQNCIHWWCSPLFFFCEQWANSASVIAVIKSMSHKFREICKTATTKNSCILLQKTLKSRCVTESANWCACVVGVYHPRAYRHLCFWLEQFIIWCIFGKVIKKPLEGVYPNQQNDL